MDASGRAVSSARMIKLRQIEYFLGILENSSFSRAAETLCVTQPTLSTQIGELEAQLGASLFDRLGREIRATEAARIFEPYARSAVQAVIAGQTAISELQGMQKGTLRIGVSQLFITSLLPPIIRDFTAAYEGIYLKIRQMSRSDIEQALARGDLDVGLSFGPSTLDSTICETLMSDPVVFVVSRDHHLADRTAVRFAELDGEPIAMYRADRARAKMFDDIFRAAAASPKIVCETDTMGLVLNFIKGSKIGAITNRGMLIDDPDLVAIPLIDPALSREIALLWSSRSFRFAAALRFADIIRSRLSAH